MYPPSSSLPPCDTAPDLVFNGHVSLELCLRAERHIALSLAYIKRAYIVTPREVILERLVVRVVYRLERGLLRAQVTLQVTPVEVVEEDQVVEEVLVAEVAVRVGQDLRLPVRPRVTLLDMQIEALLHIVHTLLTDEDEAALETDIAKGLQVLTLEVLL